MHLFWFATWGHSPLCWRNHGGKDLRQLGMLDPQSGSKEMWTLSCYFLWEFSLKAIVGFGDQQGSYSQSFGSFSAGKAEGNAISEVKPKSQGYSAGNKSWVTLDLTLWQSQQWGQGWCLEEMQLPEKNWPKTADPITSRARKQREGNVMLVFNFLSPFSSV